MINTSQDDVYFLESKQAKGAKIGAIVRWDLEGEKCSKTFGKKFSKDKICKIKSISELYTDDKKSNFSSNPNDILTSAKTFMKASTSGKMFPNLR